MATKEKVPPLNIVNIRVDLILPRVYYYATETKNAGMDEEAKSFEDIARLITQLQAHANGEA